MKEKFIHHLSSKELCATKDKILLAVSGGIDSMVMLHLFHECGFNIGVAHVNFQLRGSESDGDEQFVNDYCTASSIPFFSKRFETERYAHENSLSIQMVARGLRYAWFNELIDQHQFDFLATAHHLNDSIETAVLNFSRGSGIEGLAGIPSKNEKVIRPLLFATREQIEKYANENKITWREDRSNASDDYQRNFIRHQIIPLLKELNPSLENSFQDSVEKNLGAQELITLGIGHWEEKFESKKNGQVHLVKKGFENVRHSEGLLWNLIKGFGFNLDQCHQIINALYGQSGKKFFSHEFELVIDRDHLIVSKQENDLTEIQIEKNQSEAQLGKYMLKFSTFTRSELPTSRSLGLFDENKIKFPLTWRKWREGDSFHPLGMNHKKKLSDFFIDQKISLADKESITVLESANEIIWVVGHRIDDRYKITDATTKKLMIEFISSR